MEGGVRTLVTLPMTGKQEGMTTDKPKPGYHALTTAPVNQRVITKIELRIELQYCLCRRTLGSFSPGLLLVIEKQHVDGSEQRSDENAWWHAKKLKMCKYNRNESRKLELIKRGCLMNQ